MLPTSSIKLTLSSFDIVNCFITNISFWNFQKIECPKRRYNAISYQHMRFNNLMLRKIDFDVYVSSENGYRLMIIPLITYCIRRFIILSH